MHINSVGMLIQKHHVKTLNGNILLLNRYLLWDI